MERLDEECFELREGRTKCVLLSWYLVLIPLFFSYHVD